MSAFEESLGAVPDAVPSADEVLGPPPPDDDLPTTEDVLPPPSSINNAPPPDGEEIAHYIAKSSTGRVLDAFGQGRANGWGMRPLDTLSPEAAAELRENGLLKPYEDWRANSALTVNQALMRPAAAALDAASRANNGFSGLQSATAQAFADAGRPDLASDILSMGALFGSLYSPGLATGELERAHSLGVIGVGAAGSKGTAAELAAADAPSSPPDAAQSPPDASIAPSSPPDATPQTLADKLRSLAKLYGSIPRDEFDAKVSELTSPPNMPPPRKPAYAPAPDDGEPHAPIAVLKPGERLMVPTRPPEEPGYFERIGQAFNDPLEEGARTTQEWVDKYGPENPIGKEATLFGARLLNVTFSAGPAAVLGTASAVLGLPPNALGDILPGLVGVEFAPRQAERAPSKAGQALDSSERGRTLDEPPPPRLLRPGESSPTVSTETPPIVEALAEALDAINSDLPDSGSLPPKAVGALTLFVPEGGAVPTTVGAARALLGIGKDVERGGGEGAATEGAAAAEAKGVGEALPAASENTAETTAEAPAAASESTAPSAESSAAAAPENTAEEAPGAARESAPPSAEREAAAEGKDAGETAAAPSEEFPTQAPEEAPGSAPAVREEAPAPASATPEEGAARDAIADDVAQKLIEAGRPAEEARAIGEAVEANYEARAARFEGAKGTAQELYGADAPEASTGPKTAPGLVEAKPVAVLTGDEIAPRSADLKTLRSAARDWYRQNLTGRSVNHPRLGEITFTGRGRHKGISAGANPLKLRLFPSLPSILENGKIVGSSVNRDRASYPNTVQYHWVEAPVQVDGVTHRVRVTVEEHTDGKIYYNHTLPDQYHLQESAPAESPSKPGGVSADGAPEASTALALPGSSRPSAANISGERADLNSRQQESAPAESPSKAGGLRADGASEASAARSLPASSRPSDANIDGEGDNRNLKGPKK